MTWLWLLLIAFGLRLGAGLALDYLSPQGGLFLDDRTYEKVGRALAAHWRVGIPLTLEAYVEIPESDHFYPTYDSAYYYFVASLFYLFGDWSFLPRLSNLLLGSLSVLLVYGIAKTVFHARAALLAGLLTAIFPSFVLISGTSLRDTQTVFFITLIAWLTLCLYRQPDVLRAIGLAAALAYIRFHSNYLFLTGTALGAIYLFTRPRLFGRHLLWRSAAAALLLGLALYWTPLHIRPFDTQWLMNMNGARNLKAIGHLALYPDLDISTLPKLFAFLPVGLGYFFFFPLPWQATTTLERMAAPEGFLWYALLPFGVAGFVAAARGGERRRESLFLAALVAILSSLYAIYDANLGTMYRHRLHVLPVFLTFAGPALLASYDFIRRGRSTHHESKEKEVSALPAGRGAWDPGRRGESRQAAGDLLSGEGGTVPKSRPSPGRNALFSFLLLAVLFLLVEGVLRFFVFGSSSIGIWGFNPYGLGDLRGGIDSVVRLRPELPYRLVTDEEGLRTCGREGEGTPFRILAVGDSITFGPYVGNESTYPCLLQHALQEGSSGHRFEVLNAGVPGYTVTDEHSYILEKGLRLNPQLVLLGIHTNDPADLSPYPRAKYARPAHLSQLQKAIFYLRRLAWYELAVRVRYAALAWGRTPAGGPPGLDTPGGGKERWLAPSEQDWRTYWPAYQSHLRELVRDLRERRVPLLVILFPDPAQVENRSSAELQEALKETLSKEGVPFVDLLPRFRESPEGVFIAPFNNHLSPKGNLLAAEEVREALVKHRLIPARGTP